MLRVVVAVALAASADALQLPRLPPLRSSVAPHVAAAATAAQHALPAAAALPTVQTGNSVIDALLIRDPVDLYYGLILLFFVGTFGVGYVKDVFAKAKAQDEASAAAKADGRAEFTAAFKRAAKEKEK